MIGIIDRSPSPIITQPPHSLPPSAWRRRFRRRLTTWYARHARDLPWRRQSDPYAIWISEVMLQQTRVETVEPYFQRFLRRFPTIQSLAEADEQDVLRLWEGLGYYRRARQLHRAAGVIVNEHGGRFPRDPEAVRSLPGIGRYTAGAILSIAFDDRRPILEANTTRLFARLLAHRGDPQSADGNRLLWSMAAAVLPARGVGRFNQALMELGSRVCRGRAPRCEDCPVEPLCQARLEGLEGEIPPPKRMPPMEDRREAAVIVRRRGRVLLLRIPEGQRWAGLWDFPRFLVHAEHPSELRRELSEAVLQRTGLSVEVGKHLKTLKHAVTRFRITLDCYEARYVRASSRKNELPQMRWLRPAELAEYPLCTTGRKLSRLTDG